MKPTITSFGTDLRMRSLNRVGFASPRDAASGFLAARIDVSGFSMSRCWCFVALVMPPMLITSGIPMFHRARRDLLASQRVALSVGSNAYCLPRLAARLPCAVSTAVLRPGLRLGFVLMGQLSWLKRHGHMFYESPYLLHWTLGRGCAGPERAGCVSIVFRGAR